MGFLKTFTASAGNTSTTLRIDRDISAIVVRRKLNRQLEYRMRTNANELVQASIRDHKGGLFDVIKSGTILGDLATYSQYLGAPILEMSSTDGGASYLQSLLVLPSESSIQAQDGWFITEMVIKLTADGMCVGTDANSDFVFQFSNLQDGGVYDFEGVEGETTGTNILRYENIDILEGQHQRDLDVDNLIGLVVPLSTAFNRLLLTFGNGRIAKYDAAGLKLLSSLANPAQVKQVYFNGQSGRACLDVPSRLAETVSMPLHSVTHIEMDTDGTPLKFLSVFNASRLAS